MTFWCLAFLRVPSFVLLVVRYYLAQLKPRPAALRQLHALRSQSVAAPWQLAALPIPPGPFTSPPPTWSPVRRPFGSCRPSLGPPQPNFPPRVRAVTSPTALHQ